MAQKMLKKTRVYYKSLRRVGQEKKLKKSIKTFKNKSNMIQILFSKKVKQMSLKWISNKTIQILIIKKETLIKT